MKPNRLKDKLRAGEPAFGVSVMIPSPQIVEMIAAAGFDWVLLDCEHGTLTLESVELMAMAAEASGITAIARPITRSAEHILQVLDRGVMGVQVPHVNTAEEARAVIAAVKYHPSGRRGLAAGTARGELRRPRHAGRLRQGRQRRHADSGPARRPGGDRQYRRPAAGGGHRRLFIGPSDLSQSMGHPGNPKAPAVAQAIDASLRKMAAAGRTPGMPAVADSVRGSSTKACATFTPTCRACWRAAPRTIWPRRRAWINARRSRASAQDRNLGSLNTAPVFGGNSLQTRKPIMREPIARRLSIEATAKAASACAPPARPREAW